MNPAHAAWLAKVRAEAEVPGTIVVQLGPPGRQVTISPDDIVGKADDELLSYIAKRLLEQ